MKVFTFALLTFPALILTGCTAVPPESAQTTPKAVTDTVSVETATPLPSAKAQVPATDTIAVTRVVDGDTFDVEGGKTVRLIGVDTPETVHPSKPVQCFGKEASAKTKELLTGKQVRLEKDVSETDRYGRLLRYVYVGDVFLNDYLVRNGYANASSYPPDVKYQDQFRQAEQEARNAKRGLWGAACSATATPKPAASIIPLPSTAKGNTCGGDVYNCSAFTTCSEVMAVFNQCSYDVNKLDADGDGVPCESLCK